MSIIAHSADLKQKWRQYRLELELARNYPYSYALDGNGRNTHKNHVLEYLLPSLLYIKALALLDEGLIETLRLRSLTMPKKYHNTLRGRLNFFEQQGMMINSKSLSQAVDQRNLLAHEASSRISWDELDLDVNGIELALIHLGLVSKTGKLEFYSERSAFHNSDEPGVLAVAEYVYAIKENDKIAASIEWKKKVFRDGED